MKNLSLILGLSLLFSSCAGTATSPGVALDSTNCLMMPDRASERFVEFQGTKVGFCCQNCENAFAGMTDEEKAAKIAAAGK